MYVRIARFEGADEASRAERLETFRREVAEVREGGVPEGMPEEVARTLRENVVRVMGLASPGGVETYLVRCETREGMDAVNAALDAMTPSGPDGRRTDVAVHEVVLDEAMT